MREEDKVKNILSRAGLLSETAVLVYLGLAKFIAHLVFNGRYGYFRDELYYIICGERLAFGFVDHPPFTPLVARFSKSLFGDSLLGLRVSPALAGAATVVLAGLIARKLGGGRFAQVLAGLAVILSGVILNFNVLLTNNAFDILFWTLAAYILIVILKDDRPRLWPALGLVVGVALQNKYSIAFYLAALGVGLVLSPARKRLLSAWPWTGAGVALLVFLPNLVWQVRHGLPFIELNRNAVLHKNIVLSPFEFLGSQVMEAAPPNFLIILAGLLFLLFAPGLKPLRALGWAYLVLLALFVFSGGKPYYMAPVYPVMLAAGALALERFSLKPGIRRLRPVVIVLLIATAGPGVPFALPVLPVEKFVAYSRFLGVAPVPAERQAMGSLPQHYADQFGWAEMAESVARVYRDLPEADRKECAIFTQNYGEASAINFFGRRQGLPPAVCGHNNYWLWGPGEKSGSIIIVGGDAEDYGDHDSDVIEVARIDADYAMPYERNLPVFVCRRPKLPIRDVWPSVKQYI
jgi:4-amino-4-deoxy-L-arabinose transferase-like glycosyltransferase